MRKCLKALLFMIIVFVLFVHVFSIDVHASAIDDGANVLAGYDELDLKEYIEHAKENKYELFFVTVKNIAEHPDNYAKDYFDRHAKYADGVVVLCEEEHNTITLLSFGKFQQVISVSQANNYSNILTHALSYSDCYEAFDTAGSYIRLDFSSSNITFDKEPNFSLAKIILPTGTSIFIGFLITGIIVAVLIIQHNAACKKVAAKIYLDNTFEIEERYDRYIGERTEVIRGYYNRNRKR